MIDKNKVNKFIELINSTEDKDLITNVGKINGLISAYEISDSKEIIEEVVNQLLFLIEDYIASQNEKRKQRIQEVMNKRSTVMVGDKFLYEFMSYLRNDGLGEATIGGYTRAIKRVLAKYQYSSIDELMLNIDKVILDYSNDKEESDKYHNVHLSSLKKLEKHMSTINENDCFYVFYNKPEFEHVCQETFHVDNKNPWETLKKVTDFITKITHDNATHIFVTYSDRETRVSPYVLRIAKRYYI